MSAHPPLATLFFWFLQQAGLGGPAWGALACMVAGSLAAAGLGRDAAGARCAGGSPAVGAVGGRVPRSRVDRGVRRRGVPRSRVAGADGRLLGCCPPTRWLPRWPAGCCSVPCSTCPTATSSTAIVVDHRRSAVGPRARVVGGPQRLAGDHRRGASASWCSSRSPASAGGRRWHRCSCATTRASPSLAPYSYFVWANLAACRGLRLTGRRPGPRRGRPHRCRHGATAAGGCAGLARAGRPGRDRAVATSAASPRPRPNGSG